MWPQLIYAGFLVGQYLYHRYTQKDPPSPNQRIPLPRTEEGTPVPLLFGRCRVRSPVIAWAGLNTTEIQGTSPTGVWQKIRVTAVQAIGFDGGVVRLHDAWIGDQDCVITDPDDGTTAGPFIHNLGDYWAVNHTGIDAGDPEFTTILLELMDGRATQDAATGSHTATDQIAAGVSALNIPGYRGYITIHMYVVRFQQSLPEINFDLESTPNTTYLPYIFTYKVGEEANPADVIMSLLTDRFGKLGRNVNDKIDDATFRHAHSVLAAEGHGYSRCFESRVSANDIIDDVLRQIDGILYEDPASGRWCLKLVRADYSVPALPLIDPGNCENVESFEAGSWAGTVNKVRVVFEDRADGYRDNSATAQVLANAVGQDGEAREQVIEMRGIKTMELAKVVAARELAVLSRPLAKCRVRVGREFWYAKPGDCVRLTWPDLNISGRVMRVARVSRGAATDNVVMLEMIEDFFYTYRGIVVAGGGAPAFPGNPGGGGWTTG